jgi:ketosteroid isomerase-like protein
MTFHFATAIAVRRMASLRSPMIDSPARKVVLEFLEAFYSGDIDRALDLCTDDVDFLSYAPVELLPHLGHRRGKEQLAETWKTLHKRYSQMRYELPQFVAEGDQAACIIRIFFRKSARDRTLQTEVADFYTLRNGRIASVRQFMDSFNVVEQVLEVDVAALLKPKRGG